MSSTGFSYCIFSCFFDRQGVKMSKEIPEQAIEDWLKIMVFDVELIDILMDTSNLERTMTAYKKRNKEWKNKL